MLLIFVVINNLAKGGKIDKSMTLGSLIAFSLKNAVKNFLKYLVLIIAWLIPLGIGGSIISLLPSSIEIVGWLLVLFLIVIVSFGYFKNTLNLCQGKEIDVMAFVNIKPKSMLNLAIVLIYLILICIGIMTPFIYEEVNEIGTLYGKSYDNFISLLLLLCFLFFYLLSLSIFAPLFVIDRNTGPIEAIKKSIKLTKGHRLKIFLGFFLCGLVIKIVTAIIFAIISRIIIIEELKGWDAVISSPVYFIFWLCLTNAYLHLTGQLNETDEANGEMRNEP
jgi:hypothetical protein